MSEQPHLRRGTQVFDFEDTDVARSAPDVPGAVRLPRATDTLPRRWPARLLSGGDGGPVLVATRPPGGRPVADGLRLHAVRAAVEHRPRRRVGRPESAVPLTVEVSGRAGATPALSTTFLDFSPGTPDERVVAFTPPPARGSSPGAASTSRRRRPRDGGRLLAARHPVGLPRPPRPTACRGWRSTAAASPARGRRAAGDAAGSLRASCALPAGVTAVPEGLSVAVGTVGLLVTDPAVTGRGWLLAGTPSPGRLRAGAAALPRVAS